MHSLYRHPYPNASTFFHYLPVPILSHSFTSLFVVGVCCVWRTRQVISMDEGEGQAGGGIVDVGCQSAAPAIGELLDAPSAIVAVVNDATERINDTLPLAGWVIVVTNGTTVFEGAGGKLAHLVIGQGTFQPVRNDFRGVAEGVVFVGPHGGAVFFPFQPTFRCVRFFLNLSVKVGDIDRTTEAVVCDGAGGLVGSSYTPGFIIDHFSPSETDPARR